MGEGVRGMRGSGGQGVRGSGGQGVRGSGGQGVRGSGGQGRTLAVDTDEAGRVLAVIIIHTARYYIKPPWVIVRNDEQSPESFPGKTLTTVFVNMSWVMGVTHIYKSL